MLYAGVNGGCETFRARGDHAFRANRRLPVYPLGAEGAGVVVKVGPGASLQVWRESVAGRGVRGLYPCSGGEGVTQYLFLTRIYYK